MTKTEIKLLAKLDGKRRVSTFGKRENEAARKLAAKGLVNFVNQSERVLPVNSHKQNSMGDYVGYYVVQGYIESVA